MSSRTPEADFTTKVRPWLQEHLGTGAYEIKHTRGSDRFDMRELHEHQRDWLEAAHSRRGVSYKIPDDGRAHKPFDVFVLKMTTACVVIAYPTDFVVIDIEKLLRWQEPSLTLPEASKIALVTQKLSTLR